MSGNNEKFLQGMIEKLSILNDGELSKHSFLKEICHFFDISHAFLYETDPRGVFCKKEHYELVNNNAAHFELDMKALLGVELLSELCSRKVVVCSGDDDKNRLEEALADALSLNTFVIIPILNQHYEIAGFVGIGDRRKFARDAKAEITKACALLTLLANTVKLEMFQKGIAKTEAALSNVLDHIGIDIYVNDYYTHDILYVNKSMAEPYGGVEKMKGRKCWDSIFTDKTGPCEFCPQPKLLDENGQLNKTYTWDYERPFDKSWFRVLSSSFEWTDGRIAHLVASVDITENKRNQFLIEKLAQYDHLTGLLNRRSLHDDIQSFIADGKEFGEKWYVMFCDLDGFKSVNDTYGHEAGDVLLKGIASDLKEICSKDIKAYRQGGDEFVVLLRDDGTRDYVEEVIDNLFKIFKKKYKYNDSEIGCGCSIGVAHYPSQAATAKKIFHLADSAMYTVKKEGRGTVRFCYDGKFLDMETYFDSVEKN